MTSPLIRRPGSAAALSLLALPLAAVATPAEAAAGCTITNFSPRTVVVGLSPTRATITPTITGCPVSSWNLEGEDFAFFTYQGAPEQLFTVPYDNTETSPRDVVARAYDEDDDETTRIFDDAFTLRRHTIWPTMDVTPEPVRKQSRLTIKGSLRIADWVDREYDAYPGQSVEVEQRNVGSTTWKRFRTVKTGSGGTISTTLTATTDQCFRFVYKGSRIAGPNTSGQDCVDVR